MNELLVLSNVHGDDSVDSAVIHFATTILILILIQVLERYVLVVLE